MAPVRAAFLDRDGVINVEREYVHRIEDFILLPGAVDAMRLFEEHGYILVVITNQAGIARGLYREEQYKALTSHMVRTLAAQGAHIAGVYHCPHHPTHGVGLYRIECNCRKPKPGMLIRAAQELHIDLERSVVVGDKLSDIEAGRAAGVGRCILVRSGHLVSESDCRVADDCTADLMAAARLLTATR